MISLIKQKVKCLINKAIANYPYKKHNDLTRSIFIHIPKAAGTSMLEAIGAPTKGRLHIGYEHFEVADKSRYDGYLKFAVIRNPIDRLVSCYTYLIEGGNGTPGDLRMKEYILANSDSFENFVFNLLDRHLVMRWPLLRPQVFYICNQHKEVQMDMLLRLENINEDYAKLKDRLPNISDVFPKINDSKREAPQKLSVAARRKIFESYKDDFEILYPEITV